MNTQGVYLRVVDEVQKSVQEALGEGTHTLGREAAALALMAADLQIQVQDYDEIVDKQSAELTLTNQILSCATQALETAGRDFLAKQSQFNAERKQTDAAHSHEIEEVRRAYEQRILALENVQGIPKRNGKPWSEFEEKTLVKHYRLGRTEAEIARRLSRYCDAVCVRLGKIHTGDTWVRNNGEAENIWTQRMRDYYFGPHTGSFNTLLWHKDMTPPNRFSQHVFEAFDEVPEAAPRPS